LFSYLRSVVGKKQLLAELAHRSSVLPLIKRLRSSTLVIVAYHRIRPNPTYQPAFCDSVIGGTVDELDQQIAWLSKHTHVLSEEEFIEFHASGRKPKRLSVLITFDDGYRDNYELALPVLEKHGVPAIFFVPAGLIDSGRLGWVDLIPWLIRRSPKRSISYGGVELPLGSPPEQNRAIEFFNSKFILEPMSSTHNLLQELQDLCETNPPDPAAQAAELMTWEHLRKISNSKSRSSVGSHTHTHRVLATLSAQQQEEELRSSKSCLESNLGRRVRTLAYPVGGYRHFTHETRSIARRCGYDFGMSFCTGVNVWGSIEPFDVKRISVPYPHSISMFAATVTAPEFFSWLPGRKTGAYA
jgi:peptidoglycan/xylan/chitin deacetylase (PgdA/CDA1 family)